MKKKWVAALRSGKYKQGNGRLKAKEDGKITYCCLGVLCSVARIRLTKDEMSDGSTEWGREVYGINYHTINEEKRKEIGLPKDVHERLIEMNDKKGKSFKQIAAYIEKSKAI